MRKTKHYFGQRRGKHNYGLVLNRRGLWAVPRFLREGFTLAFLKENVQPLETGDPHESADLWLCGKPLTAAGVAFLEVIQAAPAEPDPNPPVVPFVRYSDYDLPRSPEMEAVYQEVVDGIEKTMER
jgi:hypothetical protein